MKLKITIAIDLKEDENLDTESNYALKFLPEDIKTLLDQVNLNANSISVKTEAGW